MKRTLRIASLSAVGLALLVSTSYADDPTRPGDGLTRPTDRRGRIVRPDTTTRQRPDRPPNPDRPDRPERPQLPDDVKALIQNFQTARDAFLAEQKELAKTLQNATDEQRAAIREQLRASRAEWLADARNLRQEIVDRIRELRPNLRNHEDILNNAKERLNERKRRGDGN